MGNRSLGPQNLCKLQYNVIMVQVSFPTTQNHYLKHNSREKHILSSHSQDLSIQALSTLRKKTILENRKPKARGVNPDTSHPSAPPGFQSLNSNFQSSPRTRVCFNSSVKLSHSTEARPWKSTEKLDPPAPRHIGAQGAVRRNASS